MQKQIRRALALVLASALVADAQTNWADRKMYTALGSERVVTPEEVAKKLQGVSYTREKIKFLFEKLPSPGFLEAWKLPGLHALKNNGYDFVPVAPELIKKGLEPWLVMRDPIPDSLGEDWEAHKERAEDDYKRMPTREEVMWFVEVLWKVRGKQPFQDVYVRTSTPALGGGHVCLGENEAGVLKIAHCADSAKFIEIGDRRVPIAVAPVAKRP